MLGSQPAGIIAGVISPARQRHGQQLLHFFRNFQQPLRNLRQPCLSGCGQPKGCFQHKLIAGKAGIGEAVEQPFIGGYLFVNPWRLPKGTVTVHQFAPQLIGPLTAGQ